MSPILGIVASGWDNTPSGAFESIATATPSGSATTTFSSIPSTYSALQLRVIYKCSAGDGLYLRFNGDTGSNYVRHRLIGNGTAASASSDVGIAAMEQAAGSDATYYTVAIIDIHDYASTTRNKTIRTFSGLDTNGSGNVSLYSGLWLSTSAISSVTVSTYFSSGGNFGANTSIALYGVKGS